MSRVSLKRLPLSPGCRVRLTAAEEGGGGRYECTATVEAVDLSCADPFIKASGCREVESGVLEPGFQTFCQSELLSVEVLDRGDDGGARAPVRAAGAGAAPRHRRICQPRSDGDDNPHLRGLHHLDMPEILVQTQLAPPPVLEPCGDGRLPGRPRLMPEVEQDCEHQEGEKFTNRSLPEFVEVRSVFWKDSETPPALECYPERLYVVDRVGGEAYQEAMRHLGDQGVVGLSLEGQVVGRAGELSLVCVTTRDRRAFLFDAVRAGADEILDEDPVGLRALLESPGVTKVMHDCRQASDMLANRFGVRLTNVYDTLAAHSLFVTWSLYAGFFPKYAWSVNNLARAYFGVTGTHLFFPHYRYHNLREDMRIWLERPLPESLEIGAVRNAAYLLDLQRATRECMVSPFIRATECLMRCVRDDDDMGAAIQARESHLLPQAMVNCLPDLHPNRERASRLGYVEPPSDREGKKGRRVHNSVSQNDPNVIFSRDCMHQNKAWKS